MSIIQSICPQSIPASSFSQESSFIVFFLYLIFFNNIESNKYYIHNELWLHNTVQGGGENWTAMQPQTSIATPQCDGDGEPAEEVSGGGGGVRRARSVRDGMTN